MPGKILPWFVILGYNAFIVIAGTGYLLGATQSKEYAEPEWYADLWLTIVWVAYLLLFLGILDRLLIFWLSGYKFIWRPKVKIT